MFHVITYSFKSLSLLINYNNLFELLVKMAKEFILYILIIIIFLRFARLYLSLQINTEIMKC